MAIISLVGQAAVPGRQFAAETFLPSLERCFTNSIAHLIENFSTRAAPDSVRDGLEQLRFAAFRTSFFLIHANLTPESQHGNAPAGNPNFAAKNF